MLANEMLLGCKNLQENVTSRFDCTRLSGLSHHYECNRRLTTRVHFPKAPTVRLNYYLLVNIFSKVIVIAVLAVAKPAFAVPILGDQLFYTGGMVTLEVLQKFAAYDSDLSLYDSELAVKLGSIALASETGKIIIFDPSLLGFAVGDELVFGISVINTKFDYFMGRPASRNPDNVIHVGVDMISANMFIVGFEDLFNGGDFDYNDMRFKFSGGVRSVPEPGTLGLLGAGLLGLGFARRKKGA